MTHEQIKTIFLANGFTIKEGQSDLNPYVYRAAQALLEAERQRLINKARVHEQALHEARWTFVSSYTTSTGRVVPRVLLDNLNLETILCDVVREFLRRA